MEQKTFRANMFVKEVKPLTSGTGKNYQRVTLGDGVEYSAWDNNKGNDFSVLVNQSVDVETWTNGKFKNVQIAKKEQSAASAPAPAPAVKHDSDFDIRKSSFLLALELLKLSGEKASKTTLAPKILFCENYLRTGDLGADKAQE
jgi:hypothetical protein